MRRQGSEGCRKMARRSGTDGRLGRWVKRLEGIGQNARYEDR